MFHITIQDDDFARGAGEVEIVVTHTQLAKFARGMHSVFETVRREWMLGRVRAVAVAARAAQAAGTIVDSAVRRENRKPESEHYFQVVVRDPPQDGRVRRS